jgi:carboxypeptidase family protein
MKRESSGVVTGSVRTFLYALLCAAVLAFSTAARLNAQETATVVGTVTDSSGAVIPNADVVITNQNTGTVTRTTRSNDAGNYVAAGLPASTYTVKVQKQGFQSSVHSDLVLNVRTEVRVDFTLAVGMVSTEVTVTATSVHLQTENAAISQAVTGSHVENLDINGRNFIQLATLVPGAVGPSLVGSLNQPVGVTSNSGVNFNGLRQAHNIFSVDGQENYDRGCGGCIEVIPDQDAIQEFKVTTSNAQQDLGFGSAGRVQLELKSGTSRFHGEVFEINRNRALEAQPFFLNRANVKRPKENQNDFGFNLGGPIGKPGGEPKTFFFTTLDWRRLILGNTLNVPGIPAPWTSGDFSTGGSNPIVDRSQPGVPCTTAAGAAQTCFPQFSSGGVANSIPAGLQDPNALLLAAPSFGEFLQPNVGNRLITGYTQPINVNEQIVRIDHTFSDKTSLMAHYIRNGIVQQFPRGLWDTGSYPTVGTNFLNEPESLLLKVTHSISPTLLSETMVGFNRQPLTLQPYGVFAKPSGYNVQEIFPSNDSDRIPRVNIGGNIGVLYTSGSWPWYNVLNTWTWREALTNIRGNHTLNFGVEVLHYLKQQRLFGQTNGSYNFDGSGTNGFYCTDYPTCATPAVSAGGNAFADFILGKAQQYNELQNQGTPAWINNHTGLFIGDNWKVRNGLTLNLGLRWEGMPHAYEEHNQAAVFRAQLFDPAAAAAAYDPATGHLIGFNNTTNPYLNGIGIAGKDVPRGLVNNHWYNFEPRVGFAYQPHPGGKLVVRGGVALFYENIQGNDVYNVGPNPPFSSTPQINNTSFSNPGGGAATVNPGNIQAYEFHYFQPYSAQWNLGWEYQLNDRTLFSLAYVGNTSVHQQINRNINQPQPSATAYAPRVNNFRPYLGWANINFYENSSNANYHSLQASLRFTNWHGLTSGAAYTWSHCLNYVDNDNPGTIPNAYNLGREHGNCGFDVRHTLVLNYVYSLPFFNQAAGIQRTMLGGWQVSGISTFYTGLPLTIGTSQPDSQLAHCNCGGYRANIISDPNSGSGLRTREEWFNTSAFAAVPAGQFGNGARNAVRGDGINNFDFSVFKNFAGVPLPKAKEGGTLQLRFEFYNVFNHTQFNAYNTTWTAPAANGTFSNGFGQATNTRLPRQIQLGIKLYF